MHAAWVASAFSSPVRAINFARSDDGARSIASPVVIRLELVGTCSKAGIDPSDCEWWVGDDWQSFVGPLACVADLAHPKFSEDALSKAIIFALKKSATGRRMSQILAGLD